MADQWRAVDFRHAEFEPGKEVSLTLHMHREEGAWAVLGWSGLEGGRPRLTRIWLGLGDPPDLDEFDLPSLSESGTLSARLLRTLNLTEAENQWGMLRAEAGQPLPVAPATFGDFPAEWLDAQTAREVGLRSVTDLRAAVDRLQIAFAYAGLVASGNKKPVATLAEKLNIPVQVIRSRLQGARKDEYLSSTHGKAGGEVTSKARFLNRLILKTIEVRSGQYLTDELREEIINDAIADGYFDDHDLAIDEDKLDR